VHLSVLCLFFCLVVVVSGFRVSQLLRRVCFCCWFFSLVCLRG
jgi:hypothetical protein